MKSIKRFFAVLVLIILAVLLSYLIFTGKAVTAIDEIAKAVQEGGFYG